MELSDQNQRAFEEFLKHYSPAGSVLYADAYYTTAEIFEKILGLTYDKSLKKKQLMIMLEENGFKFVWFLDNFVWPVNYVCVNQD